MDKKVRRNFTTSQTTVLFPHLIEPVKSPFAPDRAARFDCSFLLSEDDLAKLRTLISEMVKEQWGNVAISSVSLCIKERKKKNEDGSYTQILNDEGKPTFMLSAWSYKQPVCVDLAKKELTEEDVYTGMEGIGIVSLYTFENMGRKFILAGLGGVVKTGEGTRPKGMNSVVSEIDTILHNLAGDKAQEVAKDITEDEIPF